MQIFFVASFSLSENLYNNFGLRFDSEYLFSKTWEGSDSIYRDVLVELMEVWGNIRSSAKLDRNKRLKKQICFRKLGLWFFDKFWVRRNVKPRVLFRTILWFDFNVRHLTICIGEYVGEIWRMYHGDWCDDWNPHVLSKNFP